MTSGSPHLQFGIEVGGQRSYTWRVRSGAKHPELFVERENLPPAVHLSLHASGQWHMKVRRRRVHQWRKPAEITPGYTRALAIVQPVAVAMFALPALTSCSCGPILSPRSSMCGSSDRARIFRAGLGRTPMEPSSSGASP
jgi:hypothetical protein